MEPQDILKLTPFFGAVLDQTELDLLAGNLRIASFPRGTVIVRQGDAGSSMFVIADGKARVSVHGRGGETSVATLGVGDIVGEMSLMTGARRSATVTATRKLTALEITKAAFEALLAGNPDLIRRFADTVEQRHAELEQINASSATWMGLGLGRAEIAARMTAFYRS
jgi:CRP-like cAMP-binding protein